MPHGATALCPYLYCRHLYCTGVRERRARRRGRVIVDRLPQLGLRHRPGQLRHRLHGGNGRSRDRRSDDVTGCPPRLPLRRHFALRLSAQTGYPICGEDAAGRSGSCDRFHQGSDFFIRTAFKDFDSNRIVYTKLILVLFVNFLFRISAVDSAVARFLKLPKIVLSFS